MSDRTPHRRNLVGYITQMDRDLHTLRLRSESPAAPSSSSFVLFAGKHAPDARLQRILLHAFRDDLRVRCTIEGPLLIDAVVD
jgi:hypothetical protein